MTQLHKLCDATIINGSFYAILVISHFILVLPFFLALDYSGERWTKKKQNRYSGTIGGSIHLLIWLETRIPSATAIKYEKRQTYISISST